jgi:hypothetical protein
MEKIKDIAPELIANGFIFTGEIGQTYNYSYIDGSGLEKLRVEFGQPDSPNVTVVTRDSRFVLPRNAQVVMSKVSGLLSDSDKPTSDEVSAYRMIKEIKRLNLGENDKLLVTVTADQDRYMDLDGLGQMLERWIGPRNAGKILIVTDDVDMKVVNQDET